MKDHAAHLGVLFDKVMLYINVFGSAMILVIQTISYWAAIVCVDNEWFIDEQSNFVKVFG